MKQIKKGFTLVELIVVATILTILATVGFISYENYLVDARDSKRLAQLAGLRDGLRLGITKGQLPLPDDNIEIRNNGTAFLYQGYAGKNVLEGISYSEATKDPYDDTYYTYLLSRNRKDFQVMGFLEEYNPDVISSIVPESYAIDYSQRFPQVMGKKLGIVLEQDTNTPLQEIPEYTASGYMDLQDTTSNIFDAYVTDSYLISGKEDDLIGIIPYTTCKKIQESGGSYGNNIYNINPTGLNPFEVYCNMDLDGGGWTLVGRSLDSSSVGDLGWLVSNGSVRDDTQIYSMGEEVVDMGFNEIMLTTYSTNKNISMALKVGVDKNFIKDSGNHLSSQLTLGCIEIYPTSAWRSACDGDGEDGKSGVANFVRSWGFFGKADGSGPTDNRFHFSHSENSNHSNFGLARNGYIQGACANDALCSSFGEFGDKQGMIFVR